MSANYSLHSIDHLELSTGRGYQVHFCLYAILGQITPPPPPPPRKLIVDLYSKLYASANIDQLCPKTHMIMRHLHEITSKPLCVFPYKDLQFYLYFIFVKYYSRRNDLERNPVLPWCYNICLSCSLY